MKPINPLWSLVLNWAAFKMGAEKLSEMEGCWKGVAGDFKVTINGHDEIMFEDMLHPLGIMVQHQSFLVAALVYPHQADYLNVTEQSLLDFFQHEMKGSADGTG